jgi:hypothetical protein
MAPDGSLVVISSSDSIWTNERSNQTASLYGPDGDGVWTLPLPSSFQGKQFGYDGDVLYFSRRDEVCLLDSSGRPRQRLSVPGLGGSAIALLRPGSPEIAVFEPATKRLRRYTRPPIDP